MGRQAPRRPRVAQTPQNKLEYYRQSMHLARPGSELAAAMATPDPPEVDTYWRGTALVARLLKECLARGVVVHVDTPAFELLSEDGRITGVKAKARGMASSSSAPVAVVMATGGFGQNPDLVRLWLSRPLAHTCEPDGDEGDGHLMGLAVGAQLAGLGTPGGCRRSRWPAPGRVNAGSREDRILPHTLMVNRTGRRF